MTAAIDQLRSTVTGAVLTAGDPGYDQSTSPRNATARQRPGVVVAAERAEDVAAAVAHARATGLRVAVQATGHGAAGMLDDTTMLIDTRRLAGIEIDVERRVARTGTGAVWGEITAAAQSHGLIGLAGTSPTVGVAGYTFNGGWGWLTREHGMASARLRAVDYVDAEGAPRRAEDDVLWAFRGGGGIGVATAVEFELLPLRPLWAGFLLWPAERMPEVLAAWCDALAGLSPTVTSAVTLFKAAPPVPTIPASVRGRPAAYFGLCATDVEAGRALSATLARRVPEPLADTVDVIGGTDLAAIHLDPPSAVPALGDGRFLDHLDASRAQALLEAAEIGPRGPLNAIELRHVAEADSGVAVDGALTRTPAPFMLHAVGTAVDSPTRTATEAQLDAVRDAAAPVDAGLGPHAFRDGQTDAPEALAPDVLTRLAGLQAKHDPEAIFAPARRHGA